MQERARIRRQVIPEEELLAGSVLLRGESFPGELSLEEDDGIIRDEELDEGSRNVIIIANKAKRGVNSLKGILLKSEDVNEEVFSLVQDEFAKIAA